MARKGAKLNRTCVCVWRTMWFLALHEYIIIGNQTIINETCMHRNRHPRAITKFIVHVFIYLFIHWIVVCCCCRCSVFSPAFLSLCVFLCITASKKVCKNQQTKEKKKTQNQLNFTRRVFIYSLGSGCAACGVPFDCRWSRSFHHADWEDNECSCTGRLS